MFLLEPSPTLNPRLGYCNHLQTCLPAPTLVSLPSGPRLILLNCYLVSPGLKLFSSFLEQKLEPMMTVKP